MIDAYYGAKTRIILSDSAKYPDARPLGQEIKSKMFALLIAELNKMH
jgi:hypothetical protein